MSKRTGRKLGERLLRINPSSANVSRPLDIDKTEDIQLDIVTLVKNLGTTVAGTYEKNPNCLTAIKTMLVRIKEDRSSDRLTVLRYLVRSGIVHTDLVPVLVSNPNDYELWRYAIWLMYELTVSAAIASKRIPPDRLQDNQDFEIYLRDLDENRQLWKKTFAVPTFFKNMRDHLCRILQSEEEREKADHNFIGQSLQLLRNIFETKGTWIGSDKDSAAMIQDMVFRSFVESGMSGLILYLASVDSETEYGLYVLDVLYQILNEQDPEVLGKHTDAVASKSSEVRLNELKAREAVSRDFGRKPIETTLSRHSKFGGTFVLKGSQAADRMNEMVLHRPAAVIFDQRCEITADKKRQGKARNRRPLGAVEERKNLPPIVSTTLKAFCREFLENAYNVFMESIKADIGTLTSDIGEDYQQRYFWALRFFMAFNRASGFNVSYVSETVSPEAFYHIHSKLETYSDMSRTQKEKALLWSEREHFALRAYQEFLLTLSVMSCSQDETITRPARQIELKLFYVPEYREIFFTLLREFRETKHSRLYLKDMVATIHIFLKLLENFLKTQKHLFVRKKQRRKNANKRQRKQVRSKKPSKVSSEERTKLFESQIEDLKSLLDDPSSLEQFTPFDSASETPLEDQMDIGKYRIQIAILEKDSARAVALLKASKEVWPGGAFGTDKDPQEMDIRLLRSIVLQQLADLEPIEEAPDLTEILEDDVEPEVMIPESEDITGGDENGVQEENRAPAPNEVEFRIEDYVKRFATPAHMEPYLLLLTDHANNGDLINHAIIKFLHRIAYDLKLPGMVFQIRLFRIYQGILNDPYYGIQRSSNASQVAGRYKELHLLMEYVLEKFFEKMREEPKTILYTLFWKSRGEAHDLVDGPSDSGPRLKKSKNQPTSELGAVEDQPVEEPSRAREESPEDDGNVFQRLRELTSGSNPQAIKAAPKKKTAMLLKKKKLRRSVSKSRSGSPSLRQSVSPANSREASYEMDEAVLDELRQAIAKNKAEKSKVVIIRPPTPEYIPAVRFVTVNSSVSTEAPTTSRKTCEIERPKSPDGSVSTPVHLKDDRTKKRRRVVRVVDEDSPVRSSPVPELEKLQENDNLPTSQSGGFTKPYFDEEDDVTPTVLVSKNSPLKSAYFDGDSDDDEVTATSKRPRLFIDSDED